MAGMSPEERRARKNAAARARYAANRDVEAAKRRRRYHAEQAGRLFDTGKNDYQGRRKPREDAIAREQGYESARQKRRIYRTYRTPQERRAALDREILSHFRITRDRLDDIRIENLEHSYGEGGYSLAQREIENTFGGRRMMDVNFASTYIDIQTYRLDIDRQLDGPLSWDDVGYAVSYHGAVVNDKTNYPSLRPGKTASGKQGNAEQWFYLVRFAGIYDSSTYEERYGQTSAQLARVQGVPRA